MKYFYDFTGLGFSKADAIVSPSMVRANDERVKQVAIGAGILIVLMVSILGLLLGWRLLPGLLGEWVGTIVGIMSTPFFMEGSLICIGLLIVLGINIWRRHREGDEFVYLEQVSGPELPKDLPDQATWAIYREKPLDASPPSALAQAEGAFEIGDYPAVTEWISTMDTEALKLPETLELRLKLAKATGHQDLASALECEIKNLDSP